MVELNHNKSFTWRVYNESNNCLDVSLTVTKTLKTSARVYKTYDDGYMVRDMTDEEGKIVLKWFCDMVVIRDGMPVNDIPWVKSIFSGRPGCYIGEYQGKVVASCVRLDWGNKTYYGSMYYVAEEFRGRGFGTRMRDEVAYGHVREAGGILYVDAAMGKVVENNKNKYGYKENWITTRYRGEVKTTLDTSGDGLIIKVMCIQVVQATCKAIIGSNNIRYFMSRN